MARVVHQRRKIPYLLITFVFLFLISATLAVMGYMGQDELRIAADRANGKTKTADKMVASLKGERNELVRRITGSEGPVADALKQADDAYDAVKTQSRAGLAEELKSSYAKTVNQKNRAKTLGDEITKRDDAITQLEKDKDALVRANAAKIKALEAQLASLRDQKSELQAQHGKDLDQAKEQLESVQSRKDTDIAAREDQINKLIVEIESQKKKNAAQANVIVELKMALIPTEKKVVNTPDGQICSVANNDGLCYITLGSNNGMQTGMTFSVYGRDAENRQDIKGKIRVIKVSTTASECKVVQLVDENDPIRVKDNIANLAYDASRTFRFVVVGKFDLDGSGVPSAVGRQEVVRAIERFGSKIAPTIDYRTDYVVLGLRPEKPTEPQEGASDASMAAYKMAMARFKDFVATEKRARDAKIPILNQNRFLIFTGYMPEKRAE